MMPWEPTRDIMRRTIANLEFIEKHATNERGPYEITQLINSFLGAMAHPWEEYLKQLKILIPFDESWPKLSRERLTDEEPGSLDRVFWLLRNGIAHGNIKFKDNTQGQIGYVQIWNEDKNGKQTWGTTIPIADLRRFLTKFSELAESFAEQELQLRRRRA